MSTRSTKLEMEKHSKLNQPNVLTMINCINSCTVSVDNSYDESDEEDYGDEDTILSCTTSRRSILPSQECLPFALLLPTDPSPIPQQYWCEPDATTFRIRGKSYLKDKRKNASKPSMFRLFAVDIVEVETPILSGICSHPDERVQKGLLAEKENIPGSDMPPFIFCVNIVVPGKPTFHVAFFYAVDDYSLIDQLALDPNSGVTSPNPEFTKLATRFFFGADDKFRDMTFKLIPRIAKGNFVVKTAVGSKPTLLGTKVKQHYIQHERFFELVIDVGSDKVAKNIVGLSRGYVSLNGFFDN